MEQNVDLAAKEVYDTLCGLLDHLEYKYERDDERLQIQCICIGDDFPIEIRIKINQRLQIISLVSTIPLETAEGKRDEMSCAVSASNCEMVDGSFDYDYVTGHMVFRMTSSYRDSMISEELLAYMFFVSCHTVDEYNDKFIMLNDGKIDLETFIITTYDS